VDKSMAARRWWVHLGLIVTTVVSLVLEPVLTVHIGLGLAFVALVVAHLVQRRRTSTALLRRLPDISRSAGRLALVDALLAALTIAMFASGVWDWALGHPTRIRWHAITGVVLAGLLVVHTVRRWRRLGTSRIR
jgi:ABC-type thiamin/hydroxymethylpyrimidine transport system permease subunit